MKRVSQINMKVLYQNPTFKSMSMKIATVCTVAIIQVLFPTSVMALNVEMTPIQNTMPANAVVSPVPKVITAPAGNPVSNTALATSNTHSVSAQAITVSSQTFTLALPANPTTGYSWFIKSYDSNLLNVVGHRYINQNNKMIGAGGTEMWTFHLNEQAFSAPHLILISMRYARPFDVNDGTDKVITVMTRVH